MHFEYDEPCLVSYSHDSAKQKSEVVVDLGQNHEANNKQKINSIERSRFCFFTLITPFPHVMCMLTNLSVKMQSSRRPGHITRKTDDLKMNLYVATCSFTMAALTIK